MHDQDSDKEAENPCPRSAERAHRSGDASPKVSDAECPFCGVMPEPTERKEWLSIEHKSGCFIEIISTSNLPLVSASAMAAWPVRVSPTWRQVFQAIADVRTITADDALRLYAALDRARSLAATGGKE